MLAETGVMRTPSLWSGNFGAMDARAQAEKKRYQKYRPELELLLWAVWDPIGADVPLDEYTNYVPTIWRLLEEQVGEEAASRTEADLR